MCRLINLKLHLFFFQKFNTVFILVEYRIHSPIVFLNSSGANLKLTCKVIVPLKPPRKNDHCFIDPQQGTTLLSSTRIA